jgi:hypothetical protein
MENQNQVAITGNTFPHKEALKKLGESAAIGGVRPESASRITIV